MPISPETVQVDHRHSSRWPISLGGGWWVWSTFGLTLDDPERPVVAHLVVATGDDGRPRAVDVDVRARDEAGEVTTEALRIPIAEVIRVGVRKARTEGDDAPPGTSANPQGGQVFQYPATVGLPAQLPRRGRVARSDERLRRVAATYRAAEWGTRAQKVAESEGVALNTARNLISEARKRGFLERPTTSEKEPEEGQDE